MRAVAVSGAVGGGWAANDEMADATHPTPPYPSLAPHDGSAPTITWAASSAGR